MTGLPTDSAQDLSSPSGQLAGNMRLLIGVLLSLLFLAPSIAAQTPKETKKTIEIEGSVLENNSDQPIRRALVILKTAPEQGIGVYTDGAGKFTFHDLEPGTYLIAAQSNGFVPAGKHRQQTITVGTEYTNPPLTLRLSRTGAVSGRVVDADQQPVMGANIQLRPWIETKNRDSASYATTDDRGNYRAYNIPPGKYRLSVTYSRRPQDFHIQIQAAKDRTKVAEVYGITYYPGTLNAGEATSIQVDSGADLQSIDVELRQTKTVRIRGTVTSADAQSAGPLVLVMLNSNEGRDAQKQVRPDGSFEFEDVTPGAYSISALAVVLGHQPASATQKVEVGEQDVDGVQLTLARAQPVNGSVKPPPGRKLLPGLMLVLESRGPRREIMTVQDGEFTQVAPDGSFSFDGVAAGEYDLLLGSAAQGDDLYVSEIRSGGQDVLASGVRIGSSAPAPLEVVLKANGAEVDCSVVDEKQQPVPEARVILLPDPPRQSQLALRGDARTDALGKCKLTGIAPGSYHVFAVSGKDSSDFPDPTTSQSNEKLSKPVTVTEGDHQSIQLTLDASSADE